MAKKVTVIKAAKADMPESVLAVRHRQLPILHKSSTIQKKSRATPCGSLQGCMRMKESAEQT